MRKLAAILISCFLAAACTTKGTGPAREAAALVAPRAAAPVSAAPAVAAAPEAPGAPEASPSLPYPPTRREDVRDVIHGVSVEDPYRWLEDASSPEVRQWMAAQDRLAREELRKLPGRDAIAARLRELFYVDSLGMPIHRGSRYFYSRRHADREKAVVYWREGKDGEEHVLFDPNAWSKDGSVSLGGWDVSWDGTKVAYRVKENNSDEATMYVLDVASGEKSDIDVIEGAKYASASWMPDGRGFVYTWLPVDPSIPVADRPGYAEVRYHRLGEDPAGDTIVRERTGDPRVFLGAWLSRDGHWLFLEIQHGWSATDVWFRDLRGERSDAALAAAAASSSSSGGGSGASGDGWTPLAVGEPAIFNPVAWQDRFYVRTNAGAPHWRLFAVDPERPGRGDWREIVPEREDATLRGFTIVGGKLALGYLKDVASRLEIHDLDGALVREVALPGIGRAGGPVGNPDEDEAFFSFESFTFPREIRSMSVATGETSLWSRLDVPVDPTGAVVEQVFVTSRDGTKVPLFLVRGKDQPRDGNAPALLYGYGGFQVALGPSFRSSIYPWLERGGIYALANLRGGSEYGEEWHRAGMRLQKQHVFDDFLACAQWLVDSGWTRPGRLVIQGGSNGGLLVGAAMTQRPDLFAAVLCGVPLLDMVRYHLFGSGKTWIEEYGSAEDPEEFRALYAYSPYHHVQEGTRYPALLLLSADSDDRVDPMHARKFAAAMQAASRGGPVLLRIEKNSGHGGADLVRAAVDRVADSYAFALAQVGAGDSKP